MVKAVTLPCRTVPRDGEIFTSWMVRFAEQNGLRPESLAGEICRESRLDDWDLDVEQPEGLLTALSILSGCSTERLAATCLDWRDEWVMHLGNAYRPRYAFALQACPDCVESNPYFRKLWRYAWYTVCSTHYRVLVDRCECGATIGPLWTSGAHGRFIAGIWHCRSCGAAVHRLPGITADLVSVSAVLSLQEKMQRDCIAAVVHGEGRMARVEWCIQLLLSRRMGMLRRLAARECGVAALTAPLRPDTHVLKAEIGVRFAVLAIVAHWIQAWPTALERHVQRLQHSARAAGLRLPKLLDEIQEV